MHRLTLFLLALSMAWGEILPYEMRPDANTTLPHITLLDQKILTLDPLNGVPVTELSDLVYRPKRHELFALSDKGRLYRFDARFDAHTMTVTPQAGYYLHKPNGRHLKRSKSDSEGLAIDGHGALWVSFEGKPHVAQITDEGQMIRYTPLPKILRERQNHRSRNKGMEALAWHPKHGLIAALEYPPKGTPKHHQTLYSLSGKQWNFKAEKVRGNAISAIETMDDGNMLVLERAFDKKEFNLVITLKKVHLDDSKDGKCRTEILGQMSTHTGWAVDNFEGLTRVGPHRYVMVSDDNGNFFQKTLLVYFEVTP